MMFGGFEPCLAEQREFIMTDFIEQHTMIHWYQQLHHNKTNLFIHPTKTKSWFHNCRIGNLFPFDNDYRNTGPSTVCDPKCVMLLVDRKHSNNHFYSMNLQCAQFNTGRGSELPKGYVNLWWNQATWKRTTWSFLQSHVFQQWMKTSVKRLKDRCIFVFP